MLDLIYGLLGGAALGSIAAWQVLTRKSKVAMQTADRSLQDQLQQQRDAFAKEKMELKKVHERAFTRVSADLAFRESEYESILTASKQFRDASSKEELCASLQRVLEQTFKTDIPYFVAWTAENFNDVLVAGEDSRYLDVARKNFKSRDIFEHRSPAIFCANDLASVPEGLKLDEYTLVYLPLVAHDRKLGIACAYFKGNSHQTRLRVLRHVVDEFSNDYYLFCRIDEEYRASRLDPLTGLPNGRAVYDLLPPLVARATAEAPLALFFIECDNLTEINEKYGHGVGEEMILEVLKVIQTSARVEELNQVRPPDRLIRYDGLQFVMISEDVDEAQCLQVAERIREAVESKPDWPCGVPRWSVSIGAALCPSDAHDGKDLVTKAEIALMYIKEHDRKNNVIRFDQVPRHFRASKLSGGVSGSLEVFEPSVTLQTVVRAKGTGILTVTNNSGRVFWSFFDDGKMEKAYLESHRGDIAVVEFLATFDDGNFDFREYHLLDAEAMEQIHSLDDSYDVRRTMEKNLMDGALAQDQLAEAHRLLPNTRLFVKPTSGFREIIANLPHAKDPPSRRELEAMAAICRYVNGRTMLSTIMDKLQTYPTHVRWHAAALLVRHEAVELSKLALSFTL